MQRKAEVKAATLAKIKAKVKSGEEKGEVDPGSDLSDSDSADAPVPAARPPLYSDQAWLQNQASAALFGDDLEQTDFDFTKDLLVRVSFTLCTVSAVEVIFPQERTIPLLGTDSSPLVPHGYPQPMMNPYKGSR